MIWVLRVFQKSRLYDKLVIYLILEVIRPDTVGLQPSKHMLQIAVCDDNIEELSNIAMLINRYRASRNLNCEYSTFTNGFDLVSALEKGKSFDIYCLDIIMPGLTLSTVPIAQGKAKEVKMQYLKYQMEDE